MRSKYIEQHQAAVRGFETEHNQFNMSSADLVVPKGSLVLVTGANGYLASHIVDQLLERGYRVRGTVRDASKALWLQELFERRHPGSSFELVSISDYQKPGVFDNGLKGQHSRWRLTHFPRVEYEWR